MWGFLVASILAWTAPANPGAPPMLAFEPSGPESGYDLGRSVAHLLARGCTAFAGDVLSAEPPDQEPGVAADRAMMRRRFILRVSEPLQGGAAAGTEVALVHLAAPARTKAGIGPWTAWRGVQVKPGLGLLVFRWSEASSRPTWSGQPEDVALALADGDRIDRARRLIADYERWRRDPADLGRAARDPLILEDPARVGCLVTYLAEGLATRDPERGAVRLSSLLGQPSLPPEALGQIADSLASDYARLSSASRQVVTERLVEAAGGEETSHVDAGFAALTRLAESNQLDLRSSSPPIRRRLSENYRRYIARKALAPGSAELSRQLSP